MLYLILRFLVKEIVDRHTKEIEDLKAKVAAGGGGNVDLDELANLLQHCR